MNLKGMNSMADSHPNIKRPIETAPKDGTPIVLWAKYQHPYACKWSYDGWRSLSADYTASLTGTHWSPMPQESEHCCELLEKNIACGGIEKRPTFWIAKMQHYLSRTIIKFCPFCGEKLK